MFQIFKHLPKILEQDPNMRTFLSSNKTCDSGAHNNHLIHTICSVEIKEIKISDYTLLTGDLKHF